MIIFIDIETRSRCDISEGLAKYAADPSTEILCVCWSTMNPYYARCPTLPLGYTDEMKTWRKGEHIPFLEWPTPETDGIKFCAHNAAFERSIFKNNPGWKWLDAYEWIDTMHMAYYNNLPGSLAKCAEALGLEQRKDKRGSFLINKLSKPQKDGTFNEDSALLEELAEYCAQDVRTMREVYYALPPLPSCEMPIQQLDRVINQRGFCVDLPAVNAIIAAVEEETELLNDEVKELTAFNDTKLENTNSRAKMMKVVEENGSVLNGYTKNDVDQALSEILAPSSRCLLEIRKLTGLASVKKLYAMRDTVASDGRIRNVLAYLGAAQTGRWAGRGIQIQNFTKSKLPDIEAALEYFISGSLDVLRLCFGDIHDIASQCLRSLIVARPGHVLVAADYSNIEGRVLAWLAGSKELLEIYRNGACVYRDMAGRIYSKPARDVTSSERTLGKVAVLGLGYGMGASKFFDTCKAWGIEISAGTAERVKKVFRDTNPKIVSFWYDLERAFRFVMASGKEKVLGKLRLYKEGKFIKIELPSGRSIAYYDPLIVADRIVHNGNMTTYGGKLVENVTQAVARDVLANALLRVDSLGYLPPVFHVHDEIVCEMAMEEGATMGGITLAPIALNMLCETMCELPAWAAGLPLAAEGWVGKRYRK